MSLGSLNESRKMLHGMLHDTIHRDPGVADHDYPSVDGGARASDLPIICAATRLCESNALVSTTVNLSCTGRDEPGI